MFPSGTGRSTGEAGGDSRPRGDVEEGEGDLRRRFMGRLGNGGLTATGGLGFGSVGGGFGSSPRSLPCCSSSMVSEAPSGQSSRSPRETERSRMVFSSFWVTTGSAWEELGLILPGFAAVEVSECRLLAFCFGLMDDSSICAFPGISKDSLDLAAGSLGDGNEDFLSGIFGRNLQPIVPVVPGVPATWLSGTVGVGVSD